MKMKTVKHNADLVKLAYNILGYFEKNNSYVKDNIRLFAKLFENTKLIMKTIVS